MLQKQVIKSISVIGLGYIGLPTAAAFASHGIRVTGVDINQRAVDTINRGEIHIVEPGLDKLVKQVVADGYLRAVLTPEPADAFLIAVPTPFTGDSHEPDLSYIESAGRVIARVLKVGDLVILESTSPVGATEQLSAWLAEERPDLTFPHEAGETSDIRVAHCPERVLPGKIMLELVSNDRIIGGITPLCGSAAKALYEIFVEGECILTNARTAEMCKLAENAFRDVNIAYANELSIICDKKGIEVWELIQLANRHPRVNILQPGAGVGGHCIAVDPWFIVASSPKEARLIRTSREVNDAKPEWVLEKVNAAASRFAALHPGKKPIIAALGLSYKPDIDDLRESPALGIAKELHRVHVEQLIVVEPHIGEASKVLFDKRFVTLEVAIEQANILVVLVKHSDFLALAHRTLRPGQQIIDVVGLLTEHGSIPESRNVIQPVNLTVEKVL
jgi:UDP-N-acetyl-D-mannosaminuronic acid dehydrogenase